MNVLIFAVCVNLVTLIRAENDIEVDTILTLLKGRRSSYSNIEQNDDPSEALRIPVPIPGLDSQKPRNIPLLNSPTKWLRSQDDEYGTLEYGNTRKNNSETKYILRSYPSGDYLQEKILKSLKNLNKYRERQKTETFKPYRYTDSTQKERLGKLMEKMLNGIKYAIGFRENEKYAVNYISKEDKFAEKLRVEKLLTKILEMIKSHNRAKKKQRFKLPQSWEIALKNSRKPQKLLNNLFNENINNNEYQDSENYRSYAVTEEQGLNSNDPRKLLENIVNMVQNNRKRRSRMHQRPSLIFLPAQSGPVFRSELTDNVRSYLYTVPANSAFHKNKLHETQPDKLLRSGLLSGGIRNYLYGLPDSKSFHNNDIRTGKRKKPSNVFHKRYTTSDLEDEFEETRRKGAADKDFDFNGIDSDSSDASGDSSIEKNPGNPYTIHKNKYKQNWPYDHKMSGDHMNINPFAPQFGSLGPTGPQLFFGRKWWYFNQDDYKPMG